MPENLPILYQNIMYGLPSNFARDVFLWAVERPDMDKSCYKAERFAREADLIAARLVPMLDAATKPFGLEGYDPELLDFILKRHANWRFGGNVSPDYAGLTASTS